MSQLILCLMAVICQYLANTCYFQGKVVLCSELLCCTGIQINAVTADAITFAGSTVTVP